MGGKPHYLSKIDVLGFIPQIELLKLRCQRWGSNPSLLRKKVGILSSLSIIGCHARGEVYGKIVSQPLHPTSMWVFSYLPHMEESHSWFGGFVFRRNYSLCSCRFVCGKRWAQDLEPEAVYLSCDLEQSSKQLQNVICARSPNVFTMIKKLVSFRVLNALPLKKCREKYLALRPTWKR